MKVLRMTLQWWIHVVGLHAAGLQGTYRACAPPASRPKKEPGVSISDSSGFTGGGTSVPGVTPTVGSGWRAGQGGCLCSWGGWGPGDHQLQGNGHRVGSLVTRDTGRGGPLIRNNSSWDLGQVGRKVSCVGRCRWSRPWSGRGRTESKRAAIPSGLTIRTSLCIRQTP